MPIAAAVNAMNPSDPLFLDVETLKPLVAAYSKEIDLTAVENEAKAWNCYYESTSGNIPESHDIVISRRCVMIARRIFDKRPTTTFFEHRVSLESLYTLSAISKTIGASTASCENTFSALTRLLSPYRRSMNHGRLSNLVALAFEKSLCNEVTFDEFLVEFKKSPRRLLFV